VKFISGAVEYNGDNRDFAKQLIKENALPFWNCVDFTIIGSGNEFWCCSYY
jgi:alcohol dehydrogenase YqhD (iron-dependent ADH family)